MPGESSEPFLVALGQSNLLDPARLAEIRQWAAATSADPQLLAKEIARRGWLTPYQVKEVYRGRGKELILGPYVLLDLLGEGGMGRVFKAHHTRLGRDVALKVIRKEKLTKPLAIQRFHQEMRAAAQMSHPNVVLAFDADEVDGVHFFSMEYIEGVDLTRLVKERGPMPFPLACDCIRQAAIGLQHASERGLVHRDVKPSNLLLTPRGQVKVLDLGLAMLHETSAGDNINRVTQEGLVLGTPDFLAPEQAQNPTAVDIRADVYGLGATLFYLLTGRVPYEGPSATDKLLQHVSAPPPSLMAFRPDAPPQLDAVIKWMMAKRPEDRPQTPAQVAGILAPFCPQVPGQPAPPVMPVPMPQQPVMSQAPTVTAPAMPAMPVMMPPQGFPAPMPAYAPPPEANPFGFEPPGVATVTYAPAPAPEERDRDRSPARSYQPRTKSSGLPAKLILFGVLGIVGLGAIGGVGYVIKSAVVGEPPLAAEFTNPVSMKMILMKEGSFSMGSSPNEPGREDDEGPQGEVTFSKPFYISATEVTHSQFVAVMQKSNAVKPKKIRSPKSDQVPEDSVTWDEANEFCRKLTLKDRNRRSGWVYRLPTEAEWEYAARAGTTTPFWGGNRLMSGKQAIYDFDKDLQERDPLGEADLSKQAIEKNLPHPVMYTEANPWGVYDTAGNVWEWCADWYGPDYSSRLAIDPRGPETGVLRVIRGGSWKEIAARCRSAARQGLNPNTAQEDVGFRVVFAPARQ